MCVGGWVVVMVARVQKELGLGEADDENRCCWVTPWVEAQRPFLWVAAGD